ncbi:MAG: DMT family transporter [Candidatus Scalindua sp.]
MGYLKIISAILIWSSLGIFVRKIALPNADIIFYSAVIAGLVQFFMVSLTGRLKKTIRDKNSANSIFLLILLPVCFLGNTLLFYFAFTHTTIANAVLTHYTAPIFVALMAPVFLKEKILKTAWFAIILSSLGLWLILGAPASGEGIFPEDSESRGIIAGVISGFAYALLILIIRGIASQFSALFIIFIQNSLVALLLLPFVLNINLTLESLPYILILGIVHSTVAPLLYVQGFRSVKANEAAILGYLEPIGAILLAWIFLNEIPEIKAILGGALILYSGFMIIRNKKNHSSSH